MKAQQISFRSCCSSSLKNCVNSGFEAVRFIEVLRPKTLLISRKFRGFQIGAFRQGLSNESKFEKRSKLYKINDSMKLFLKIDHRQQQFFSRSK